VEIDRIALIALACLVAPVPLSYAVEALRRPPSRPSGLAWAPGIPVAEVDLGGVGVRYVKTGAGPNLVLLHTLRTQLDIFQKALPALATRFTVHAFDYPGHGWSDIPNSAYAPEDFYLWAERFLERLDIRHATLAGISIGGTIALVLAARQNPRVARVIAINPYDYFPAGGIRVSSLTARLILGPADVPVLGPTLMRLRSRFVTDRIMEGGVASADALPPDLLRELYETGARPGHYQGFLSLLAHEHLWPKARDEYARIAVPTLLVYGDEDWAPAAERERERNLLPRAEAATIPAGGHFLSLDRPRELEELIARFAAGTGTRDSSRK